MKKVFMWCLIGLLSLGSVALSQAQTPDTTEKAVAALEQQWLQSQKTNNPDLVAPLGREVCEYWERWKGHEQGRDASRLQSDQI
jgi:hypothetical protein